MTINKRRVSILLAMVMSVATMGTYTPILNAQSSSTSKTIVSCDFQDDTTEGWYIAGVGTLVTTSQSIKFSDKAQSWGGPQYDLTSKLQAGKEYEISFDAAAGSNAPTEAKVTATIALKVGGKTEYINWSAGTNATWEPNIAGKMVGQNFQTYVGTFKINPSIQIEDMRLTLETNSAFDLYVDNFVIKEVNTTVPTIKTVYSANFDDGNLNGWVNRGGAKAEIVSNPTDSSKKSLKVTGRNSGWEGTQIDLSQVIKDNQEYTYSFKIYCEGTDNQKIVLTHTNGNQYNWAVFKNDVAPNTWTEVTGTYTAPDGSQDKQFYIEPKTTSGESSLIDYYIDDVVITTEESGSDDTTNKPEGTITYNFEDGKGDWGVRSKGTLSESNKAQEGSKSLYISNRDAIYEGPIHDMTNVLTIGSTYNISTWVMYEGESEPATKNFEVCMQVTSKGNQSYPTVVKGEVAKGKWTQLKGTYTVPKDAEQYQVYVQTAYTSNPDTSDLMDFYIDNMVIEKKIASSIQKDIPDLYKEYEEIFKMGAAVAGYTLTDQKKELVKKHFNSITAENEMKPESMLNKEENKAYFAKTGDDTNPQISLAAAKNFLDFAKESGIKVRGHVLTWHAQTPVWFFKEGYDEKNDFLTKEQMIKRMRNYIKNVFEALEEQYPEVDIYAWDVVNETIDPSQPDGYRKPAQIVGTAGEVSDGSLWMTVIGSDFVEEAFKAAREYAPEGTLLAYNDYNECNPAKRDFIYTMCKKLAEDGYLDVVGMQGHYGMTDPTIKEFEAAVEKFGSIKKADGSPVQIQVTELDISLKSNSADDLIKEAYRYKELIDVLKNAKSKGIDVGGVTVWGVRDNDSWIGGYPLLFDENYQAKDTYWALVDPSRLPARTQDVKGYGKLSATEYGWEAQSAIKIGNVATFKVVWDDNHIYVNVEPTVDVQGKNATVKVMVDTAYDKTQCVVQETILKQGAVIEIPVNQLEKDKKLGLDIVVNIDGKNYAWNDTYYSGTTNPKNFGCLTLKELPKMAQATKGTPTIDGQIDLMWDLAEAINVNVMTEGVTGATAKGRMLWDEDHIYILAEVKDDLLSDKSSNDWEQDSIEIFLDQNNEKTSIFQEDDGQYRINFKNKKSVNGDSAEKIQSATQVVEGGYIVEAAISRRVDGFKANQVLGFELQVNNDEDGDGNRDSVANWNDKTGRGWSSTENYGLLKLVGNNNDNNNNGNNNNDNNNNDNNNNDNNNNGNSSGGGGNTSPTNPQINEEQKPQTEKVFKDIPQSHWAHSAIQNLTKLDLLKGVDENNFKPNDYMIRGDMAILIERLLKEEKKTPDEQFKDVASSAYYAQAIGTLKQLGLFVGENGNAYPENYITRQDAMVLIGRVLEYKGIKLDLEPLTNTSQFKDSDKVADYAEKYIAALTKSGVVQGDRGYLNPQKNITRAEIAVMIEKVLKYYL